MRNCLIIFIFFLNTDLSAQTLGGQSVFNFLKLPATPQQTALGGLNLTKSSDDAGMAFHNPALLTPAMHTQLSTAFNAMYGKIKNYTLLFAYHHRDLNTNFLWGLNYFDYGSIVQTDAGGNIMGNFKPNDWVMHLSASRTYLQKWKYGGTIKFISSNYGQYRSNGIAVDFGVMYSDTAAAMSIAVLGKNIGTQLRKYDGTDPDDLPFDLQLGITKRLASAPFSFSLTAHHLHRFDILYQDENFNNENGFENVRSGRFTLDKLFRHFVFATTIYLGDKVEVDVGYNYLRRKELNIGQGGNGLTGFSMGAGLILPRLQVRYARSAYQNNTAYNQFGINMTLNKYFGLKKFGERIGW